MRNERVTFRGAHGHELSARLSLPPDGEVVACALFAHCFTCSKDLKPVVNISRALTQARIAVLRFDFTGLGESEVHFDDTTFSSNVEDLLAAAEHMVEAVEAPTLLVGHSLGGAAVLQAAARLPSVRAVCTIGAPFDPAHVKRLFSTSLEAIEASGEAEVTIAGRPFTVSHDFVRDLAGHHMEEVVGSLRRPSSPSTLRWTGRWASRTPRRSIRSRATRRASSPSTTPTTCSSRSAIPCTWARCWPPGPGATSISRPSPGPWRRFGTMAGSRPARPPAPFAPRSWRAVTPCWPTSRRRWTGVIWAPRPTTSWRPPSAPARP